MEVWKNINGSIDYEVSNLGRVRKIVTITEQNTGYKIVTVKYKEGFKNMLLSRLVASAFCDLNINDSKQFACHKDDDKSNNCADNLFVGTNQDNVNDMVSKGRQNKKISDDDIINIKKLYFLGINTQSELCKIFSISKAHVSKILNGKTRKNVILS